MTYPEGNPPMKFFVDFENVHGAGLKGVEALDENAEVYIFYSQAAETLHIEHAIELMKSKAHIEFVEVDNGTRNALDFQLVTALFGSMDKNAEYAIVSCDGGFDAAIKMSERMGLAPIRRISNIQGDIEPDKAKTRRSRGRRQASKSEQVVQKLPPAKEPKQLPEPAGDNGNADEPAEPVAETGDVAAPENEKPTRRSRRRRQASAEPVEPTDDQAREDAKHDEQPGDSASDAAAPVQQTAGSAAEDAGADDKQFDAPDLEGKNAAKAEDQPNGKNAAKAEGQRADGENASDQPEDHVSDADAPQDAAPEKTEKPRRSGRMSKRRDIKDLLADRGAQLNAQQLSAVMKALNGVKDKREFYQRIIKAEGQTQGLELYRLVRDSYQDMIAILRP